MAERERKSGWRGVVCCLVLLPVLYALSAGPAVWITARFADHADTFNYPYAPMNYLAEKSESFRKLYLWYLDLWLPEDLN